MSAKMRIYRNVKSMRCVLIVGQVLFCVGCGDASQSKGTTVGLWDSAGVRLVEAPQSLLQDLPQWTLTVESDWGGVDAIPAHEFYRVEDVNRLKDGTVAVVNRGTGEVRFFAEDGALQGMVGGMGDGPHEFRGPIGVEEIRGDSLVVVDRVLRRITIIDSHHKVARTARLEGRLATISFIGVLDGRTLAISSASVRSPRGTGAETSSTRVLLFDLTGRLQNTVGTFPERRWVRLGSQQIYTPTFDPVTSFAPGEHGIWVGTGRDYRMDLFDPEGQLEQTVRWAGPSRTVADRDKARWKEERLSAAKSKQERQAVQAWLHNMVFADEMAAYKRLVPAADGGVWVECYDPHEGNSTTWLALDANGRPQAVVHGSGHERVYRVDNGHATAAKVDELGIAHVIVYKIDKALRTNGGRGAVRH